MATPSPDHDPPRALLEGPRGEGWVALQAALLLLYLIVPRLGPAWPEPLRSAGRALGGLGALGGGLLLAAGSLALGRQLTPLPHPKAGGALVEHGPYRLVRHPIYSGVCLGALGGALLTAHGGRLAVALLLLVFFDAKARREEAWLIRRYPAYPAYRRRVRRLIPWLY
jgi:protein-S-isoprenylcysteine O-methyltransferase Ste14